MIEDKFGVLNAWFLSIDNILKSSKDDIIDLKTFQQRINFFFMFVVEVIRKEKMLYQGLNMDDL